MKYRSPYWRIQGAWMRKTESALLGRSNVATTFNLYVRSNLNQEKKRVERMGKFLGMAEL